jgi:hypothetical protein
MLRASPVGVSGKAKSSWMFCRMTLRERRPNCHSIVRAFGRLPSLLCPLLKLPRRGHGRCRLLSPGSRTRRGSPEVRPTAFAAPAGFTTPAFDDRGLRSHVPARPAG